MNIKIDHIPISSHKRPGTKMKPTSITIHSTQNPKSTAQNERDNLARESNLRSASFHYAVDDKQAIECIPTSEIAYHAGNKEGNNTSIGIEICESGNRAQTIANAIELTKIIMAKNNIKADKVIRHYDWTKKSCPIILMDNNWQGWKDFKSKLNVNELPIISKSNATIEQMKEYARKKGATDTFISLADIFYEIGINLGINHSVAYCQSARETGFGKFGGVIDETYHNPCGLKTTQGGHNKDPEAHQRFSSWREGITAQYDHLALYAGHEDYPRTDSPDPRHFPYLKGKCKTVEALSNNWATDGVYGYAIVDMVKELESIKVDKTHWAKKHYDSLMNKGIAINEERFNDNITRGEVFALLDRIVEG